MKKIVILVLFLSLTITGFSQQLRLGLQLSPAISWLNSNDNSITGAGPTFAFKLGPIGEYYFQENYAFIGGVNLVFNAGGVLNHSIGGTLWPETAQNSNTPNLDSIPDGSDLAYKIQFVEIPFGLKFRTNEIGYFRYFAEIPFYLGIATQSRGKVSGAGYETSKENINPDMNFLNVSWGLGAGMEYAITQSTSFIAALTFQSGFLDLTQNGVQRTDNGEQVENSKVTMNAFNIKLGVMF